MSVLRSRSSTSSSKVFLLSGLSGDERRDLAKKITLLGGIYFDIEVSLSYTKINNVNFQHKSESASRFVLRSLSL